MDLEAAKQPWGLPWETPEDKKERLEAQRLEALARKEEDEGKLVEENPWLVTVPAFRPR